MEQVKKWFMEGNIEKIKEMSKYLCDRHWRWCIQTYMLLPPRSRYIRRWGASKRNIKIKRKKKLVDWIYLNRRKKSFRKRVTPFIGREKEHFLTYENGKGLIKPQGFGVTRNFICNRHNWRNSFYFRDVCRDDC